MTDNNNNIFSAYLSNQTNPTFPTLLTTSTTLLTPSTSLSLETLAITSLSTLESLIETSGELFNSLLEYSSSKEGGDDNNDEEIKRQKVLQCYERYKKFEKELKGNIDDVVKLQEKKKQDEDKAKSSTTSSLIQQSSSSDSSNSTEIDKLIKTRDSLLQESDTQKTHLTNLLEQTYKLQFQIQTLLACSEQHQVIAQSEQQQQQQQQ